MAISTGSIRKALAKNTSRKDLKASLRYAAKTTTRTVLGSAALNFVTSVTQMVSENKNYILGTTSMNPKTAELDLVAVGEALLVFTKVLKIKVPALTKKQRLNGTRGAAMLELLAIAHCVSAEANHLLFGKLVTNMQKKDVKIPATGKTELREVPVVDVEEAAEVTHATITAMREVVKEAAGIYWPLCYNMLGKSPADTLSAAFPAIAE